MHNNGYIRRKDIMPYLRKNLAYWNKEDIYKSLEQMPLPQKIKSANQYIKKSTVMYYLTRCIVYWNDEDVAELISYMPTVNGLMIKVFKLQKKKEVHCYVEKTNNT